MTQRVPPVFPGGNRVRMVEEIRLAVYPLTEMGMGMAVTATAAGTDMAEPAEETDQGTVRVIFPGRMAGPVLQGIPNRPTRLFPAGWEKKAWWFCRS